ncbi:hypothetical protein [Streptomyces sp. IB2014 011-1]|uniref:hypothetical protein n=1 Tax=Streptomyces sp. IB2014 011-1 TaxID=1844478 RepID=UPI0009CC0B1E|nr:hypothetical protein [Streptomyces sp. IB2014 011-1]ONI48531.1 hypothetical protein STIB_73560 [Streptomyces sp. IB2014 011-1]
MTIETIAWAIDAGADPGALAAAWGAGRPAPIPIGRTWDIIRLSPSLGAQALARTRHLGRVGPVLRTTASRTFEVVVPLGTAHSWPHLPGTCAVSSGALLCPPPTATVGRPDTAGSGRLWICSPLSGVDPTDPHALCEGAAAALARRCAGPDAFGGTHVQM